MDWRLDCGAATIPKGADGGEDGFFISHAAGGAAGVADGVGGWRDVEGADVRSLVDSLMREAARACEQVAASDVHMQRAMSAAWDAVPAHLKARGSTTLCAVRMLPTLHFDTPSLAAVNLGDSGLMLLRRGPRASMQTVLRSRPQTQGFNFPLQLGGHSPHTLADADRFREPCQAGDVALLGTDGLFDNLFDDQIAALVAAMPDATPVAAIAQAVANRALEAARRTRGESPFALEAAAAGHAFRGGKMDDITVVVCRVVHAPPSN